MPLVLRKIISFALTERRVPHLPEPGSSPWVYVVPSRNYRAARYTLICNLSWGFYTRSEPESRLCSARTEIEGSEIAGLHVGEQSHQSTAFCCAASILGRTFIQLFSFPELSPRARIQKETKTEEWDYNFVASQGHLLFFSPLLLSPQYCFMLLLFRVGALAPCRLHPWKSDLGELCVAWVKCGNQQAANSAKRGKLCLCTPSLWKVFTWIKIALGSQEFYQVLEKLSFFHASGTGDRDNSSLAAAEGAVCDQPKLPIVRNQIWGDLFEAPRGSC